jgi:hypothetical protein
LGSQANQQGGDHLGHRHHRQAHVRRGPPPAQSGHKLQVHCKPVAALSQEVDRLMPNAGGSAGIGVFLSVALEKAV